MSIPVKSDIDAGVPHLLLDIFGALPLVDQQTGTGMPQIVEADCRSNPCRLQRWFENPRNDIYVVQWPRNSRGKDQVLVLIFFSHLQLLLNLTPLVCFECVQAGRRQIHRCDG